MTIYMACCCETDTLPCTEVVSCLPSQRFFVVEGKANVFYSHSLEESWEKIFEGSPYCNNQLEDCVFSSVNLETRSHRMFASVNFKAIMRQDGFPGFPSAPAIGVVNGYLLINRGNSSTQAQGRNKYQSSTNDCAGGGGPNWTTSDSERSWNQSTDNRETAEISFSLSAGIKYLECGGPFPSPFHRPCTADLLSGCYEVWNLNVTFKQFGAEANFESRGFSQYNEDLPFGGTETITTSDYDANCNIVLDDLPYDRRPETRISLSTLALVGQDEPACFLQQRREPIVLFDNNIPWQIPHCWVGNTICDNTAESGCLNWGDHLGANRHYVEGDGQIGFLQNFGIVSFAQTTIEQECGLGSPCDDDDETGCIQWYLPNRQNEIATLPECPVFWGDGSYKSFSTSGSEMVPQTECGEALGDECIRAAVVTEGVGTDCPQVTGFPDPGPFRYDKRTADWSGQSGAGFTITRFEELPELPDPVGWENV